MADMVFGIRQGRAEDFARLQWIEIDAFETLRQAGGVSGEAIASTRAELQRYVSEGCLLVAVDDADIAIGYICACFPDGWLHIAEMDVARAWQRQGVGRALMLAIVEEGRLRNLIGATLTTDMLAPFNASFYASLGFAPLAPGKASDRLCEILREEYAAGFDPARRVAMQVCFRRSGACS